MNPLELDQQQRTINSFRRIHFCHLPGRKLHFNEIVINELWTEATKTATRQVARLLEDAKIPYYTEVPLISNTRRADFVLPTKDTVIEIYDSESQESILQKMSDFNKKGLICIAIPAKDEIARTQILSLALDLAPKY